MQSTRVNFHFSLQPKVPLNRVLCSLDPLMFVLKCYYDSFYIVSEWFSVSLNGFMLL